MQLVKNVLVYILVQQVQLVTALGAVTPIKSELLQQNMLFNPIGSSAGLEVLTPVIK